MIWLIPIEDRKARINHTLLEMLCEAFKKTFDQGCTIQRSMKPPAFGKIAGSSQYIGARLLEALPIQDNILVLGVTSLDLSMVGYDYTTGLSDLPNHRAIIGISRLQIPFDGNQNDLQLFSERVVKRAIHELGHTQGLPHCADKNCVMNLSDNMEDIDQKSHFFCEMCKTALKERSANVSERNQV